MAKTTRKSYSPQFKAKVALEAVQGLKTINEIAQKHGIHPVQISTWKKEVQKNAGALFDKKRGKPKINDHERPENLYSEIGRLWRSVKYEDIYLKEYICMKNLFLGLTKYFEFYNHERPHQSKTPDKVYRSAEGGGARITDKFKKTETTMVEEIPVPLLVNSRAVEEMSLGL